MAVMVRKSLLEFLFSGAFMKRWNDKLRPVELVEVDKQGHKMIVAWMLFEIASRDMSPDERLALGEEIVRGGMFDFLYRLVITDIKPPIFYQIKANPSDYRKLSGWVLDELKPILTPLGPDFAKDMRAWLLDTEENTLARRILTSAHLYASYSEFKLLKQINEPDDELHEIEQSFIDRLGKLKESVNGVDQLLDGESVLGWFARMCGRLRFQKRWSQTPRVPETTVLGHMFIVACYSWFFSLEVGACRARSQNNFFAGLFHDLPELLTRDIISPVKRSAPEIADLIQRYERQELDRKILSPLAKGGHADLSHRLSYLLGLEVGSEFKATTVQKGKVWEHASEALHAECNRDDMDPKDGELLKMADKLAAFIEAYTALKNGISSDQLYQACYRIQSEYRARSSIAGIQVGPLLADFS